MDDGRGVALVASSNQFLYEFRVRRHRRSFAHEGKRALGPCDAATFLKAHAEGLDRETFYAIHLDTQMKVLGFEVVAVGGMSSVEVHPREVFRAAILRGSASLIVAHNHPSGDPEHSPADLRLVRRLREAGEMLGIEVVDSLVLFHCGYSSLADDPNSGALLRG